MFRSTERQTFVLIFLSFVVFGLFLLLSNHHDWDLFLSFAEVDRRAWISGEIPIWSYQFCSGVSRIGNPQSFGVSPLFIPILLLGSFWGLKITVFLAAIIGIVFFSKILRLISTVKNRTKKEVPSFVLYGISTLMMFSNAFLWQAHVGHVGFSILLPIGIGIFYYTLKGYLQGLRWSEHLIGIFFVWSFYSGGLYHALIFFMIPLYLSWILFIVIRWIAIKNPIRNIVHSLLFHATGILISFYKVFAVWEYQNAFPRIIVREYELSSILDIGLYHSIPTFFYKYIIPVPLYSRWAIWEYSAFSLTTLLCIYFCILFLRRIYTKQCSARIDTHPLEFFTLIALVVFLLFSLGNIPFGYSPFAILNAFLSHSIRVIGRFHMGLTFTIALALFLLLLYERKWFHLFQKRLLVPALILLNLNFLTFGPTLSLKHLRYILSFERDSAAPMQEMVYTGDGTNSPSYPLVLLPEAFRILALVSNQYPYILKGKGILDCWDYFTYERNLKFTKEPLSLIDPNIDSPPASCIEGSFFTQNTLSIDESCPSLVCLNIQSPNRYTENEHIVFNEEHQKYCWQQE